VVPERICRHDLARSRSPPARDSTSPCSLALAGTAMAIASVQSRNRRGDAHSALPDRRPALPPTVT
jgi:hypothetical protein